MAVVAIKGTEEKDCGAQQWQHVKTVLRIQASLDTDQRKDYLTETLGDEYPFLFPLIILLWNVYNSVMFSRVWQPAQLYRERMQFYVLCWVLWLCPSLLFNYLRAKSFLRHSHVNFHHYKVLGTMITNQKPAITAILIASLP